MERAIYYKNKEELGLALDILDELIMNDDQFAEAYYYRAKFIIIFNKDYKYAIKDLRKIIKLKPSIYKYNSLLADYYFHEMKYKKALEFYISANRNYPYELTNNINLAKSYYRSGDFENAILYMNKYTEVDKKNVDAYKLAGQIYYDKGDMQQSINYLTKAVYIENRRLDILMARGKSYLGNEEYQRAGRDFNIALDLDSQNGELWYLKGIAFFNQDKIDEACKYFKKASYLNYYKAEEYLLQECQ